MLMTGKSQNLFGGGSYSSIVDRRRYPTFEFRLFPGTGVQKDLLAYSRLVLEMFDNAAEIIANPDNLRAVEPGDESPFAINPYKYTVANLHDELKSEWLKKWVKGTVGEAAFPVEDEEESAAPEAVACAA